MSALGPVGFELLCDYGCVTGRLIQTELSSITYTNDARAVASLLNEILRCVALIPKKFYFLTSQFIQITLIFVAVMMMMMMGENLFGLLMKPKGSVRIKQSYIMTHSCGGKAVMYCSMRLGETQKWEGGNKQCS